ncbi:MAG: lytic transglycosylase, partial [Boseongicola sp.]|nr:lytic transglycosylase [Boseongicola sp.]
WYFNASREELGISLSDTRNQYLAYHEGRTGYRRGSYRAKGWLLKVSNDVASRAITYDAQLRSCGKV